jgi:hypothetical protein
MDRYERLANAFVGLADTLVADYDVIELAQQLIDSTMALLPIAAAGILLGDPSGGLHVFASSSEQSRLLELLQVEADVGPCLEAYRSGQPVLVENLAADAARWPAFAERADEYGFRSLVALPLRLRNERVGALNLFLEGTGPMTSADVAVGQALADVATIGILHQRVVSGQSTTAGPVEHRNHHRTGQRRALRTWRAEHGRRLQAVAGLRSQPQPSAVRLRPACCRRHRRRQRTVRPTHIVAPTRSARISLARSCYDWSVVCQ